MHPDTPQSRPITFLTWFGSAVLVFTVLVLAGQAASAMAANISYVGSDGNVWRISPDTLRERGRFGEVEAPSWDRLLGPIVGMLGPLVIGLVAVIIVLGFALVILATGQAGTPSEVEFLTNTNVIFLDGFGTGDTSAWSLALP